MSQYFNETLKVHCMTTPEMQSLFRYLISKANNMQLVGCRDVKAIFAIDTPHLQQSLRNLHSHCQAHDIPLFSSIVIDEKSEQSLVADCSEDALICTLRASLSAKEPEDYPPFC